MSLKYRTCPSVAETAVLRSEWPYYIYCIEYARLSLVASRRPSPLHRFHLQISIILIWQWHLGSTLHLGLVLCEKVHVDLRLWWSKSWCSDELKSSVTDKLAGKPKERLLEVVIRLCGDIVVLEVLLSVECDGLGLDLSLLDIDLVSTKDDWNVLANTD